MAQFKYDPTIEEKYNTMVFSLFEGPFEEKKDLLKETAVTIGESKDYKVLCVILHLFADTMLTDEYIRKGWWHLETFKSYIYFIQLIDTYIEMPKSYFNNQIIFEKEGDVYFNYYIALRTLYDHSIVPYDQENFLYGDVTSFATLMQEKMRSKPHLLIDENDERILNNCRGYSNLHGYDPTILFKKTYNEYLKIKNKTADCDNDRIQYFEELESILSDYNEAAFDELTYKIIKNEDTITAIYFIYEFMSLSNSFASRFGKFRSWFIVNKLQEAIGNIYSNDPTVKTDMWSNLPINYEEYFALFKVLLVSFLDYVSDATKFEIAIVKEHQDEIKKFQKNTLEVNKFYTDILGKNMDSFFYNFLEAFFNPSDSLVNFGTEFTKFELNPLCLIWMQLSFYNNCNSSDYLDDLLPLLTESMDSIYYPEHESNYVPFGGEEYDNASVLQCELFNDFKDNYMEVYGERENPMKGMNFNQIC